MFDPQTIAIYVAGAILVPVLAAAFRSVTLDQPIKLWLEFVCSLVLAYGVLVFTSNLPLIPALPFGEPLAFIAAFGAIWVKVFGLASAIYLFLGEKLQSKAYTVRAHLLGKQSRPGEAPGYPRR